MSQTEQHLGNHARFYPLWHFFAFPVVMANAVMKIIHLVREPGLGALWSALFAVALMMAVFASRVMALSVQNRVIRLEERLRLAAVLPAELQPRIEDLTVRQLVALRFASDDELPQLVKKTLDGALTTGKEIKAAINKWRADHVRA